MYQNKISLATSAFNIIKNDFDIEDAIKNWSHYVDEIVIATMPSEDDSHALLLELDKKFDIPIKIIANNDSADKVGWDGRLKNSSHQAASHEIVAQLDLDERFSGPRELWRDLAGKLLQNDPQIKGLLIPSVNLYKDYYHYSDISAKWYLVVKNGVKRGIVNFAKTETGFDRNRSDSTEAIMEESDNLIPAINFTQYSKFQDALQYCRSDMPFVWHLGYVSLERRANINKGFWRDVWNSYSDGDAGVKTEVKDLEKREVFEHKIPIDFL